MEVLRGNTSSIGYSATRYFRLRFTLEQSMILNSGVVSTTSAALGDFGLGENLSGACGGSGVCNYGLKDDVQPLVLRQEMRETRCLRGTCEGYDIMLS